MDFFFELSVGVDQRCSKAALPQGAVPIVTFVKELTVSPKNTAHELFDPVVGFLTQD